MSAFSNVDPIAAAANVTADPFSASRMQSPHIVGLMNAPAALDAAGRAQAGASVSPAAPGGFGAMVSAGLVDTNDRLNAAETALQSLAVGGAGSLHTVMVSMEGAKLAFQLVAQVRNHLLSAYQDIVKMQI